MQTCYFFLMKNIYSIFNEPRTQLEEEEVVLSKILLYLITVLRRLTWYITLNLSTFKENKNDNKSIASP